MKDNKNITTKEYIKKYFFYFYALNTGIKEAKEAKEAKEKKEEKEEKEAKEKKEEKEEKEKKEEKDYDWQSFLQKYIKDLSKVSELKNVIFPELLIDGKIKEFSFSATREFEEEIAEQNISNNKDYIIALATYTYAQYTLYVIKEEDNINKCIKNIEKYITKAENEINNHTEKAKIIKININDNKDIFQIDIRSIIADIHIILCFFYSYEIEHESSKKHEDKLKIKKLKIKHLRHTFIGKKYYTIPIHAFSFRKCTSYLYQALINEEINLSSPKTFNDPCDCPYRLLKDKYADNLKIACFANNFKLPYYEYGTLKTVLKTKILKGNNIEEYKNMLMWAHYADSHKGICIKYKFDENIKIENKDKILHFQDVEYSDDKLKNISFLNIDYIDSLCLKSEDWKYENELRLIYYNEEEKGDYATIKAPQSIEAIYFGYKCSAEDKKTIYKLLKDKKVRTKNRKGKTIKFFEMNIHIDKGKFGQLYAREYHP